MAGSPPPTSRLAKARRGFWQPPRAHGEVLEDRSVSFLELFYDLVYVVVIAQAAHHLAEHVSWEGAIDFAIVFGLVWIAWFNGTFYHDLHGRLDGRTRTFTFVQMGILALLAVFTAGALGEDGTPFALTYSAFVAVLAWLWYAVRREDRRRGPSPFDWITSRYLAGMLAFLAVMVASAFVGDDVRRWVWGVAVLAWVVAGIYLDRGSEAGEAGGATATDALIERFGLFTIIVLGEVVVGVVDGILESDRTTLAVVTGLLGLCVGFAYWWTYFDFIGGRRWGSHASTWMLGHLPATASIAASGAAVVGIIEHAGDGRVPASSAWLMGGAVAVGLLALALLASSIEDHTRLAGVFRPLEGMLVVAAAFALVLAWARPAPWLFLLLLWATLSAVWFTSVLRWYHPDAAEPAPGTA